MKLRQSGFTLIEIAIVLVIIGLLLGGVLKGQELITQAKIKNVMSDFSGVTAAYYGYQDRYRTIPGDDPGATARWGTGGAAPPNNGDGNGAIEGLYNAVVPGDPTTAQESNLFWAHLRCSGFVAGPCTGAGAGAQPNNAVAGLVGVQTGDGAGGQALKNAAGQGFTSIILCSSNLPDKIAIAVDGQLDDGIPASGQVRGFLQTGTNPAVPATATAAYAETGSNTYLLCKSF